MQKHNAQIQYKVNSKFESCYEPNFLRYLHTLGVDAVLPEGYAEINIESLTEYSETEEASNDQITDLQSDVNNASPLNSDNKEDSLLQVKSTGSVFSKLDKNQTEIVSTQSGVIKTRIIPDISENEGTNMPLTRTDYHN